MTSPKLFHQRHRVDLPSAIIPLSNSCGRSRVHNGAASPRVESVVSADCGCTRLSMGQPVESVLLAMMTIDFAGHSGCGMYFCPSLNDSQSVRRQVSRWRSGRSYLDCAESIINQPPGFPKRPGFDWTVSPLEHEP